MLNITVERNNNDLRTFRIILMIYFSSHKNPKYKDKERLFLQDNEMYINFMTFVQLSICENYFNSQRASFSKITKASKIY